MDELRHRKTAMVAALWSNSNWDGEEANRQEAVDGIEANFEQAVALIYGDAPDEAEIDYENDAFFAAAKRGVEKINDQMPEKPDLDDNQKLVFEDPTLMKHTTVDQI